MADLLLPARWQVLDANGDPAAGAKARFYETGTTTPKTVYADEALTTPHPSPLVADGEGVMAAIFSDGGAVKAVVTKSDDSALYTLDPVTKSPASGAQASSVTFNPTADIAETNVQGAIEAVFARAEQSLNPDPAENRIINGGFDVWQRGTSSSASGYKSADRWAHYFSGGAITVSRITTGGALKLGQNTPPAYLRYAVSGQSGANYAYLQQRIEGVGAYSGETVTVLGYARRFAGTGNLGLHLTQNFGTGGSSDVTQPQQIITLSAAWAPLAVSFAVPSISGKTIGGAADDYLNAIFSISNGGSALGVQAITVDLWGVHIRRGTHDASAAGYYTAPPVVDELRRCQRYCENTQFVLANAAFGGAVSVNSARWSVKKRATPTLTLTPSSGTGATVTALTVDGFYQGATHSVVSAASVLGECEL